MTPRLTGEINPWTDAYEHRDAKARARLFGFRFSRAELSFSDFTGAGSGYQAGPRGFQAVHLRVLI